MKRRAGLDLDVKRLNRLFALALVAIVAVGIVILIGNGSGSKAATPRQLAEREAAERLAAAPLPPGSRRVDELPAALDPAASSGKPKAPDVVSRVAGFATPMSVAEARAWFAAHPSAGITATVARRPEGGATVRVEARARVKTPATG
jgi:hypothetical protein